jgi:nitrogen fixation/metabolism regulation signal transduction histidine kinase
MVSGRYNRNLTILAILLAITSLAMGWVYFHLHAWITLINLLILWFLFLGLLLYQVRRVNRDLGRFFEALRNMDSSVGFKADGGDRGFKALYEKMNSVIEDIALIKSEKERAYNFFHAVFDHADAGLLVYNEEGNISLINRAAQDMLGIGMKSNIHNLHLPGGSVPGFPGNMKPGERALVKIKHGNDMIQLAMRSRQIKITGNIFTLLSLQNIRQELEENEIESWQKLMRVFIHEIMNSVSPITLTATGLIQLLETDGGGVKLTQEKSEDLLGGLRAIRKRSKGMAAFMESYKQLTRIPLPDFSWIRIQTLFEAIHRLMKNDLEKRGISFSMHCAPKDLNIWGDEKLVEQVIINLLRNALDATGSSDNPEISLACLLLHEKAVITVQDNGHGMDPSIQQEIFMPFFTTKPEGSGIGLSISRQIMNLHKGNISVQSRPGHTVFQLGFPLR